MSSEKGFKKQVSILATFMPVTTARKKASRNAETRETGEKGKNDKNGDENSGTNFA